MEIRINNISYFVEIHQQDKNKENLFLLHGFMGSGRVFESVIERLKSCCNPITIDLLGHGKTQQADSAARFHTEKQIEDLEQIISEITTEPVYLHGYSMGGRLALQFALAHPELLKGLILESSNAGLQNKRDRVQRRKLDHQRARQIEENFKSFLDNWSKLPLFNNQYAAKKDQERYKIIQHQQNPQQMAYSLDGFGTGQMQSLHEQLHKLAMPVLLMAGKRDEKYKQIAAEMNKLISSSSLSIIPNAGHRIHVDQSVAFKNQLKRLLFK